MKNKMMMMINKKAQKEGGGGGGGSTSSYHRQSSIIGPASPPRYVRLTASDRWIESGGEGGCGTASTGGRRRGVVRKGYVPVMVGGDGMSERFLIPTQLMAHPSVLALLDLSAEEFGYKQQGVIQIPCDPDYFRDMIKSLPFKEG